MPDGKEAADILDLQFTRSKFCQKINELKALRSSTEDAFANGLDKEADLSALQDELDELISLKQKYEAEVESLRTNVEAAILADKSFAESLNAFLNVKVNVEKLIRRMKLNQPSNEIVQEDDHFSELLKDATKGSLHQDYEVTESESELKPEEEEKKEVKGKGHYCKIISLYVWIAIGFYFILGLVISQVLKNEQKSLAGVTIGSNSWVTTNQTCGADSFMLRDSVCDDTANMARCLYDGGDCCLEFKETKYCKSCACILDVDQGRLRNLFSQLNILPVDKPTDVEIAMERSIVEVIKVEDVVSGGVCGVLCLDHEARNGELNSWIYLEDEKICKCGWIESVLCPEKMVNNSRPLDIDGLTNATSTAFIQLGKTVPCDCSADGFLVESDTSYEAQEDHADALMTKSLWHCQEVCDKYKDCIWISWRKPNPEAENDGGDCCECRLMMALPTNHSKEAFLIVDSAWITSSKHCSMVQNHFERYSSDVNGIQFVCPGNGSFTNPLIATDPQDQQEFLLLFNGLNDDSSTSSSSSTLLEVFKIMDNNINATFIECTHSLAQPEEIWQWPTGGIMTHQDDIKILFCGGKIDLTPTSSIENTLCTVLNRANIDEPSSLVWPRTGAASLVTRNGTTLWVAGGFNSIHGISSTTEFVTWSPDNQTGTGSEPWLANSAAGPSLPDFPLQHHCLLQVSQDIALINGGGYWEDEGFFEDDKYQMEASTWSIDVSTIVWNQQAPMDLARSQHACGVLALEEGVVVVVVAGGAVNNVDNDLITKTVELLLVEVEDAVTFAPDWVTGPDLPDPISNAASMTTSNREAMFILGGTTSYGQGLSSVLRLQCAGPETSQCYWTKIGHEMSGSHAMGVALTLPSIPMLISSSGGSPPGGAGFEPSKHCTMEGVGNNESFLLVTTGFNFHHDTRDTEVYVVNQEDGHETLSICYPHAMESPMAMQEGTGGVIKVPNRGYIAVICEGKVDNDYRKDCYRLGNQDKDSSSESKIGSLKYRRVGAVSAVIRDQDGGSDVLWVTGGFDSETGLDLDSTERIEVINDGDGDELEFSIEDGIPLPAPMTFHCIGKIDDKVVIVSGGQVWGIHGTSYLSQVWTMNFTKSEEDQAWASQPPLSEGRMSHGCGVIQDGKTKIVVVAGGYLESGGIANGVEILRLNEDDSIGFRASWEQGPDMPVGLDRSASATTEDQTMLFMAGGILWSQTLDPVSNMVFYFTCLGSEGCRWNKDIMELLYTRSYSIAMIIPPEAETAAAPDSSK